MLRRHNNTESPTHVQFIAHDSTPLDVQDIVEPALCRLFPRVAPLPSPSAVGRGHQQPFGFSSHRSTSALLQARCVRRLRRVCCYFRGRADTPRCVPFGVGYSELPGALPRMASMSCRFHWQRSPIQVGAEKTKGLEDGSEPFPLTFDYDDWEDTRGSDIRVSPLLSL